MDKLSLIKDITGYSINICNKILDQVSEQGITYELSKINGVGKLGIKRLLAAKEFAVFQQQEKKNYIRCSRDAFLILKGKFTRKQHEEFYSISLTPSNGFIALNLISIGGISGTVTDVRIIAKKAIENGATGLVLAHNHPSGALLPSEADKSITKKIKEGLLLLDINVLDHIIVCENSYYSFADEGII